MIKTIKSKVSADFKFFLTYDGKKIRIIDLFLDYIIKHKAKVLNILRYMEKFILF